MSSRSPVEIYSRDAGDLIGDASIRDLLLGKAVKFVDRGVDSKGSPVKIHYALLGADKHGDGGPLDPRPKVVLVMGLAAACACWRPQLEDIMHPRVDAGIPGSPMRSPVTICVLDNRGCGHSSSPRSKKDYSTTIMAHDVFAVLDALQWTHYHVVGFSMGGMIASKMAAQRSAAVLSLTLISSSLGGWACVPRSFKAFRYGIGMLRADTAEKRAHMDIRFHFTKATRQKWVVHLDKTQHEVLAEEYMETGDSDHPTPKHGTSGQAHACWHHSISDQEAAIICAAPFSVMCAHGRYDLVAPLKTGEKLAAKLKGTMVILEGAHMSVRECGHEVSFLLEAFVLGQPRMYERNGLDPNRHMLAGRNIGMMRRSMSAPAI